MRKFRRLIVFLLVFFIQVFRVFVYRYLFSDNQPRLNKCKINHPVRYCGKGSIFLDGCDVGVYRSPGFIDGSSYIEARHPDATVIIGAETKINNSLCLISYRGKIEIGCRCLIGSGVTLINSDFHVLKPKDRGVKEVSSFDVMIGDDVFIGNDVKVLKGVTIGDRAIIGAGAIVSKDVPSSTIFINNG